MNYTNKKYFSYFLFFGLLAFAACDPSIDENIAIPALPATPMMSAEADVNNPNRIIVKDLSDNSFARVWDLPGGTPNKSTLAIDTILYTKAGNYAISLHAAAEGGGGTAFAATNISIEEDAIVGCSEQIVFLTGGCDNPSGKCWTFSQVAGAVSVGPDPGSTEWFTSLEGGLVPEQYDDSFCFVFDGSGFQYLNNGQTIDPFNGYAPIDLDPPTDLTYFLAPKAGGNGETRIVLPEGAFMGVMDSGPLYDIIRLTENELVVRSRITNADGWFDLYFVAR